jgi:hypothetical protein
MRSAKYIKEIGVNVNGNVVNLEVYQHPNGGIFGIDSSYLEQNYDDDANPDITDPFDSEGAQIWLTTNKCNF